MHTEEQREKDIADLNRLLSSGDADASALSKAVGIIVRERGVANIAEATGLNGSGLYYALRGTRSQALALDSLMKILHALGLRLQVAALEKGSAKVLRPHQKPPDVT